MKEPFMNLDTLIDQTKLLSDMELQAYLLSLNDSQRGEFVAENVKETINAVDSHKAARFTDLIDQATGADNNLTSAAYFLARTRDLASFVNDVDDMTTKQINVANINDGLTTRQHEINEWANSNKLDTLYFMQVLFISLSLVAICAFMLSNGTISSSMFAFISYMIGIIAIVVIILRWRYTRAVRDNRYWSKARFHKPATAIKTNTTVALVSDTTCPK
jgi:hypothetical protein